jgi:adenylate kinase
MNKHVILITGTPAVGKTTLAKKLAEQLKAQYINLTDLAKTESLVLGEDKDRDTTIIDETKMRRKLRSIIEKTQTDVIIDGHYGAAVTPKTLVTNVFVLRRNPIELREFMKNLGYTQKKQEENLSAEILDVCLVEALSKQNKENICELDVTGKPVENTLNDISAVLDGKKKCYTGCVDWLGMLEREGKTDEFLKL